MTSAFLLSCGGDYTAILLRILQLDFGGRGKKEKRRK